MFATDPARTASRSHVGGLSDTSGPFSLLGNSQGLPRLPRVSQVGAVPGNKKEPDWFFLRVVHARTLKISAVKAKDSTTLCVCCTRNGYNIMLKPFPRKEER